MNTTVTLHVLFFSYIESAMQATTVRTLPQGQYLIIPWPFKSSYQVLTSLSSLLKFIWFMNNAQDAL